jgi:transposase
VAYREVDVVEVKEVLRRWLAGSGKKRIARELGLSPRTVRRYVGWAEEAGAKPPGVAAGAAAPVDEAVLDALARTVSERRHEGRGRPRGQAWAVCEEQRAEIERLLHTKHVGRSLTLKRVRKLLGPRKSAAIPYSTLHRFAVAELGYGQREPSVPVADGEPGKEVQIDTGWVGEYALGEGKKRRFKAWIFTPVVSRYRFAYPIERETVEEAIEACEAAWEFYGGVFEVVIPDNTKAIVERADPLDARIVRVFLEYSQARDFFVDTTRVRKPKDKPRVESSVRYVRNDCFAGELLRGVEDARTRAVHWSREEAGLEIHRTTRRRPREHFEAVEKAALKQAPTTRYDTPKWSKPGVAADQHAQVLCALYSLPRDYVGQNLDARADRQTVRFYVDGQLVKTHPRVGKGERKTDPADFPAERFATAQRDEGFFVAKAHGEDEWIGKYAEALLASKLPWTRMRRVHALLRLSKVYGIERVAKACRVALEHGLVDVRRVERMVVDGRSAERAAPSTAPAGRVIPFPKHLRPASSYALRRTAFNETTEEGRA